MAPHQPLDDREKEVMRSLRFSRLLIPILIGIGVVGYLLWDQFDPEEFAKIQWRLHTLVWILIAFGFVVVRHIVYALRLYILSDKFFSFRKCIELIFIWEFSSAITPTSFGGTAVALFLFSKERLPLARTASIIIYTVVLDTAVFLVLLPLLFLFFGTSIIRPDMTHFFDLDGWGVTFLVSLLVMLGYASFFWYGLFRNPGQFRRILVMLTFNRFLRRFRTGAVQLGNDIILASRDLARHSRRFHLLAFTYTLLAWSCRFLVVNALIIAIVPGGYGGLTDQLEIFGRQMAMYVIMAFSPTPGGAGLAEIVFDGFLSDFVPTGISLIIAFLWRLLTYYSYLFAGAIVVPAWLQGHIKLRRKRMEAEEE
ncbi:MAG: lysylphosphatidylglycerol synthase transmembrane domain-containing protein [Saprospiraceae bacterium]